MEKQQFPFSLVALFLILALAVLVIGYTLGQMGSAQTKQIVQKLPIAPQQPEIPPQTPPIKPVVNESAPQIAKAANVSGGGKVLVDLDGMTLYTFANDTNGASACLGKCEVAWPPLVVFGRINAGEDVAAKLSTIDRPDGSKQLTYYGRPLYYYAYDTKRGDMKGDGLSNGAWKVVRLPS